MAYMDISCLQCGPMHANVFGRLTHCPSCNGQDVVAMAHDFEMDARFRHERAQHEGAD